MPTIEATQNPKKHKKGLTNKQKNVILAGYALFVIACVCIASVGAKQGWFRSTTHNNDNGDAQDWFPTTHKSDKLKHETNPMIGYVRHANRRDQSPNATEKKKWKALLATNPRRKVDSPLSLEGFQTAKKAAVEMQRVTPEFRPSVLFVSPFTRCLQTAAVFAQHFGITNIVRHFEIGERADAIPKRRVPWFELPSDNAKQVMTDAVRVVFGQTGADQFDTNAKVTIAKSRHNCANITASQYDVTKDSEERFVAVLESMPGNHSASHNDSQILVVSHLGFVNSVRRRFAMDEADMSVGRHYSNYLVTKRDYNHTWRVVCTQSNKPGQTQFPPKCFN